MLTPRENFLRFFRNETYEWVPSLCDQLDFFPEMIPDNVCRGTVFQQHPFCGEYGGTDLFGVSWTYEAEVEGAIETAPLFEDIEEWKSRITLPDPEKLDWERCAEENSEYLKTDKLIHTMIYTGFFERLISFVGFENAAMALVVDEQKESVKELFSALTEIYIKMIRCLHKYFNVELVQLHDDWGTQKSTMFSVATHQEMILPYIRRIADAAHEEGVFLEMHSCGMIEPLIPGLISSGADTWRGQDVNDKEKLVNLYGDQFKFAVWVYSEESADEAAVMDEILATAEKYRGKRIWLANVGKELSEQNAVLLRQKLAIH